MSETAKKKEQLLEILRRKSVVHGDFTLSSGIKSKYYVDCKLTTLDPHGAWLVGWLMYGLIREQANAAGVHVQAVGGLTMGADPIALAVGMVSAQMDPAHAFPVFSVRKTPKAHGQTKLIEGNFQAGNTVVVLEDVVTRGESSMAAINAVLKEGGKVAFAAVLVDREEGGRERIEALGCPVHALFQRKEVFD